MADLASQLRVIAEHAKALREAGVSHVKLEGVEFTLLSAVPEMVPVVAQQDTPKNPLEDHSTYGLAEGSPLPGFRDPRKGPS